MFVFSLRQSDSLESSTTPALHFSFSHQAPAIGPAHRNLSACEVSLTFNCCIDLWFAILVLSGCVSLGTGKCFISSQTGRFLFRRWFELGSSSLDPAYP
jgi:hypothetical protein